MIIYHLMCDYNGLALLAYYFNIGCDPKASKFVARTDQVDTLMLVIINLGQYYSDLHDYLYKCS